MGAQLFYLFSVVKALFEPSGMSQDRGDHHQPTFRDTVGKLGCAPFGFISRTHWQDPACAQEVTQLEPYLGLCRQQFLFPSFDDGQAIALKEPVESLKCFAGITDQEIKGLPIVAVLAIMVGNDVFEAPSFP